MEIEVKMERQHICKEESMRLDIGGEGQETISDDFKLLNLNDWDLGSPCNSNREVGRVPGLERKDSELHCRQVGFSEVEGHPGEEASR